MIDPAPSPLRIERRGCVLVLSGEVDANTAPQLASHLCDALERHRVELDTATVTFMDSTGLRVILTGLAPHLSVEPPVES